MNGAKPVNPPDQSALPLSDNSSSAVGPGLGTLLQGRRAGDPVSSSKTAPSPDRAARQSRSLRWTLLAADALLVLLAVWLVLGRSRPLSVWEILLCVLAFGLAACLGCWAFFLNTRN